MGSPIRWCRKYFVGARQPAALEMSERARAVATRSLQRHSREAGEASRQLNSQLESGFTLIELTVVALIMIILLSIAIPTFLAVRSSGRNRAAQADLHTALQAAQRMYISTANYSNVTATALQQVEPSLSYVEAGACGRQVCNSSGPNDIVVLTTPYGNPQAIEFASWSASGTCWFLLNLQDSWPNDPMGSYTDPAPTTAGTYYGKLSMSSSKSCNITGRNIGVNGGGWATSFGAAQG